MGFGWKWWTWLSAVGGFAGALLVAAAQVSAEQGTSNLASWVRLLGLINLAGYLRDPAADRWGLILGAVAMATAIAIVAWHFWWRKPKSNVVSVEWSRLGDAIDKFCTPEFVSISTRYSDTFQRTLTRYREIEAEMATVAQGGWTDRPEALEKYNFLRDQFDRLGGVLTASQQGWNDIWTVLRDELIQMLISGELIARGFVEPHSAGACEAAIKPAEWRILEPELRQCAAIKKGDPSAVIYSNLEIARGAAASDKPSGSGQESPLEIIFDVQNPHKRFWSLEQLRDETGSPVPGHLWWEYRVLVRNRSGRTLRNVKATVEAIGPMPTRPEPSQFDASKKAQIDLNPHTEELLLIRRWYNPPIMVGMVMGGAYGPIKMKVSADDVLPTTKFFHFEPEKTPMISEIVW